MVLVRSDFLLVLTLTASVHGFAPPTRPVRVSVNGLVDRVGGCVHRGRAAVAHSMKPTGEDWEEYGGEDDNGTGGGAFGLPAKDKAWDVFGLEKASLPSRPPLAAEDMTSELFQRVLRVSIDALDNFPPQEVARKLDLLWEQGPSAGPEGESLQALAQLTEEVEGIEEAAVERVGTAGADLYGLEEAIRIARSQIRTYVQHADFYDPDHWLSQGDISEGKAGWFNFWGRG